VLGFEVSLNWLTGKRPLLGELFGVLEVGERAVEELAAEMRRKVRSYNSAPITYLLTYVYMKFPSFASNSVIREKVEGWRRMYRMKGV
jgi:hypothetical protein